MNHLGGHRNNGKSLTDFNVFKTYVKENKKRVGKFKHCEVITCRTKLLTYTSQNNGVCPSCDTLMK